MAERRIVSSLLNGAIAVLLPLILACGSTATRPDVPDVPDAAGADVASLPDAAADALPDADASAPADVPPEASADLPSADAPRTDLPSLTPLVDPMIGTKGSGNVVPGPCVPHGMVKLSPDTYDGPGTIEGYEWTNDRIEGFSHTHLEGPGGSNNGYSQILVRPFLGDVLVEPADYAQKYSHDTETALPGYYAVTLGDPGVRAELTASRRCGVHRYTFPASDAARILIDAGHTRGAPVSGHVEIAGSDTIRGTGVHQVHPAVSAVVALTQETGTTGVSTVFFVARFSRPFDTSGTVADGKVTAGATSADGVSVAGWAGYATTEGSAIEVRVGISFVSVEQAQANLDAECAGLTFEEVRDAAEAAWDRLLSRIEVEGGTDDARKMFYSALYHSLMQPADYTEDGRFLSPADGFGTVVDAPDWRYYTDDWCLWDTFRTTHPLLTIVEPEVPSDMVRSLVHMYEKGGWMPKCPWNATGDSRVMTANPQFSVVADAWQKGFRGYDGEKAYAALRKGSMEDSRNALEDTLCGYFGQGTPPDYVKSGWVPIECDPDQAASMTLEHAYDDWCVSVVADGLGKSEDAAFFRARSASWKNVFNPATGFAQSRHRDGTWVEPFDPTAGLGFCEANSWQYTWSVQHDVCGLVTAMGGVDAFVTRLDALFDEGRFVADNEPDFHVPWLYDYVGRPDRATERVADVREAAFGPGPDGLPGNDDAGATSAWYVLAAIGLYPVAPGDGWYSINVPAFDRVGILIDPDRGHGRRFDIVADGAASGRKYIVGATLNGKPLDVPRIAHTDVAAGGTLVLTLAPAPAAWATSALCKGDNPL